MCREFWYRYPPAKLLAACPTVVLLGVKRGIEHCRLAAGPVCQKPSEHHRKRFRSPVWNEQCAAISFGSSEKSVGEFARVGANFIPPAEQFGRALETTDLLTSGRSACLTGLSAQSGESETRGRLGVRRTMATAQIATRLRKKLAMKKRRSWDAGNIAENTVNKGSGEPGGRHPCQSHPQISRTRPNMRRCT
jgi:hypothetical protein